MTTTLHTIHADLANSLGRDEAHLNLIWACVLLDDRIMLSKPSEHDPELWLRQYDLWWAYEAMLVVGSVVRNRREDVRLAEAAAAADGPLRPTMERIHHEMTEALDVAQESFDEAERHATRCAERLAEHIEATA